MTELYSKLFFLHIYCNVKILYLTQPTMKMTGWTVRTCLLKLAPLLLVISSFVMNITAVKVNIQYDRDFLQYDSASLHALRPPVEDPVPRNLIDNVNILLDLQVGNGVRRNGDLPARRQQRRARGQRGGGVRLKKRGCVHHCQS